jgi:DNA mismatch repair protein MutL
MGEASSATALTPAAIVARATGRILPLSVELANQIAAGEVVERPAAVVKELIENSLDAGASEIRLELELGGLRLIRVTDNGAGIERDDLPLAIAPHATSKISHQHDLAAIVTLGFRGEALASIASVARMTITSRRQGATSGWRLAGDGSIHADALAVGTVVEVRDLFYNLPARRKFLRSERTEYLHIETLFRRLALSRFDIGFSLIHNQKRLLHVRAATSATERQQRIATLVGHEFVRQARQIAYTATGMALNGWVVPTGDGRTQGDLQHLQLNGRIIRDRVVRHAIHTMLQSALPAGRHPAYLLWLTIDPAEIDVNVHPTKSEVRFRDGRLIYEFMQHALQGVTESLPLDLVVTEATAAPAPQLMAERASNSQRAANPRAAARGAMVAPPAQSGVSELSLLYAAPAAQPSRPGVMASTTPLAPHANGDHLLLFQRYLLLQQDAKWWLIDLARARKQWLLDRLEGWLEDGEVASRPLLMPITAHHPHAATACADERLLQLARLGIVIDRLGRDRLLLRQLPLGCSAEDGPPLLQGLLAAWPDAIELDAAALLAWFASALPPPQRLDDSLLLALRQLPLATAPQRWGARQITEQRLDELLTTASL